MPDHLLIRVSVSFTEKEYLALRRKATLLDRGLASEAVRQEMSLSTSPYGYTKSTATLSEADYMQHHYDGRG